MLDLINRLLSHLRRLYFHTKLGGKIKPYDLAAAIKDLEKLQAMAMSLSNEQRQAIEEEAWKHACSAVCQSCQSGFAAYEDLDGYWYHVLPHGNEYCDAQKIHNKRKERNVL